MHGTTGGEDLDLLGVDIAEGVSLTGSDSGAAGPAFSNLDGIF